MKLLIIFSLFFLLIDSFKAGKLPEPEFEGYTLGTKKENVISASPSHSAIRINSLNQDAIVYLKENLKYALWFYKDKLYGIVITGKIPQNMQNEYVEKYTKVYGSPGYTFEFGFPHYYWYFFIERTLYTIELKHFSIDIRYSLSDTGIGSE